MTKAATHAYTRQNCNVALPIAIAAGAALAIGGPALPVAFGGATVGAAIAGCNSDLGFSAGIGDLKANGAIFGVAVGAEGGIDFGVEISHTSAITDESDQGTTISFVLADPDVGDELVIDIYHEPVYGSFVFDLKAGITKCVWEGAPTLMGEDPKLTVIKAASQFVFPNDEMIFDLEALNVGEFTYSSFYLVQDTALQVKLDDGGLLDGYGNNLLLYKEQPMQRFVRIFKPQNGYQFDSVKLTLKSVCDSKRAVSVLLSNSVDENGNPKLKWLEPCPRVEWAGNLRRDRTFLVNTKSNDSSKMKIKVFNPLASKEKISFNEMTKSNGRLENVNLLYRKVGEANWKNAQNKDMQNIDFAVESMNEDPFGYVSEHWNIGNLADGNYELTVEARCSSTGGPEDFDYYRESSLVGVIDNSRPEQFGKVLPLKDELMFGEEITIVFTEPLDCSIPFKFDVKMILDGDWENPFFKDKFHIICDGRQIRLQIDHTNTDPELILGKNFKLEVGKIPGGSDLSGVFDVHGNKRYKDTLAVPVPITIERKFAQIDLKRALTKFSVSKEGKDVNCSEMDSAPEHINNELRSELAALSNSENEERFIISELSCDDRQSKIQAKVEIIAQEYKGSRDLLQLRTRNRVKVHTSTRLLAALQTSLKEEIKDGDRRLATRSKFTVNDVYIIPSEDDAEKFAGTEEQKEEERQILEYATSNLLENQSGLEDFINEFKRENVAERMHHEREKEEEIRLLREQMRNMIVVQGLIFTLVGTVTGLAVYFLVRGRK